MMILLYRQIKKTEGWKRSISRQKIIEVSMIFGQVLLLTFLFFFYRGRKFYHVCESKRSSFFGARFRNVV